MAKQDYIPKTDGEFLAFHDNFNTQVAAVGASLGLTAGEIAAVATRNTEMHAKAAAANTAKANSQAKTSEKQVSFRTGTTETRALGHRFKSHPSYTTALGEQLGIVGPEDTTDLTNAKPTLKATAFVTGSVTINFNKSTSSGVRLESKRAAEADFSFLAIDTESPYVDTRANLSTAPELRQYRARYILGDDPIGLVSDVLAVTVPG